MTWYSLRKVLSFFIPSTTAIPSEPVTEAITHSPNTTPNSCIHSIPTNATTADEDCIHGASASSDASDEPKIDDNPSNRSTSPMQLFHLCTRADTGNGGGESQQTIFGRAQKRLGFPHNDSRDDFDETRDISPPLRAQPPSPLLLSPFAMNSPYRAGMQVHGVPDEERAYDVSGRKLPWAYEYADSNLNRRSQPEKGPFGKSSNRRSYSRSKTATPSTKEDLARQETSKVIDDIFGPVVAEQRERHAAREQQKPPPTQPVPHARSAADLTATPTGLPTPHQRKFQEPTEVMLYGFGGDYQYAAIEYYENASKGRIFEDYDRQPPHPRYNTALSMRRSAVSRTLPRDAIAKINAYKGGDHWIKVTFDSPEAAELACHYSPKIINGYLVYCELYRGVGPNADIAIPAAATADQDAPSSSLTQRRTTRLQSQQRAFNSLPARTVPPPALEANGRAAPASPTPSDTTASSGTAVASGTDATTALSTNARTTPQHEDADLKPLRIPGAKRAVLLPASAALLPVAPWTTRVFGSWPIIGSLLGGDGADIIGGVVPRTEAADGTLGGFDWARASFWWRACWWVDQRLGTDLCGMRGEE